MEGKRKWDRTEDGLLSEAAPDERFDWNEVSKRMKGRTPKQCRDRYVNFVDPLLWRGPITEEEEQILLRCYSEKGPRWSETRSHLPGRSEEWIKNSTTRLLRRKNLCEAFFEGMDPILEDAPFQCMQK